MKTERYVRPELLLENLIIGGGVALSTYNNDGLQDIPEDYVFDQTDNWKE